MPDEKARVGFSLDFKDSQAQINALVKALEKVKKGFNDTGREGEASVNRINLGMKTVFQNITAMSSNLRRGLANGQKMSRKELGETLNQAKALEGRLLKIHEKTTQKFVQSQGEKRKALKATSRAQEQALNQIKRITKETEKSLEKQRAGYGALASILSVKVSSVLRNLVKESALLAARNEVLGTAMRTVGNNAGISNAELSRTEVTVRKLGISINDTRELISRFAQAQLGMENATRLARAAQDLAAGSTLGSSEALRIMTQSILSLLPRQLRQFGVVVNLNQVYQEQSRILGKSVNALTSLEKRQGLLNKIFEEAAKRAGAYERSMEDSGKVLTTLSSRIIPDTLSMLGDQFLPILEALVFGFKDLLEWIQKQEGGLKTFISVIIAVGAAVTSVVGAFTLLSGIVGAATGGFTGFSAAAGATLAGLGPLALGIGAVTAALVLLPQLLGDSITAQEKFVESSKEVLNIQLTRLAGLESLQEVLKNQALTEEEVAKVVRSSIGRHKELIPLLNKEGVTRQEVVDVLAGHIEKQKELVALRKGEARNALEADIERLKDEQFVLGALVQKTREFEEAKREDKDTTIAAINFTRSFTASLSSQQQALENLSAFLDLVYLGDLKELSKRLADTDSKIKVLSQDLETDFGTAAKKTQQSVNDMEQSFLGLNEQLTKLSEKTTKKFPFQALIKEQEEFQASLDKSALTDERRRELTLKSQETFQARFEQAELKFRKKLDSIGATALQKIEANRSLEVKVNQGSALAIQAIAAKAAQDRNTVYETMWQDRLQVTQTGVDAISEVIRTQRNLAIARLKQEADGLIAKEGTTTSQRIEIRQSFYDSSLALLRASQEEESSVRQQYFQSVASNIQELFSTGTINETKFNDRSRALATELNAFRQQQIDERISFHKTALDEMYSAEVGINARLKQLAQDKKDAERSTEDAIRSLRQQGLTEHQVFIDERQRAEELLSEGETALRENRFERVKEIDAEIRGIAQSTSKEIRANGKKDAELLISADKARIGSIELVEQAGGLLQRSFEAQRAAEETALIKVKDRIDEVKSSLDALLAEKKQIEIEVIGEAEKQIAGIQRGLDSLQDKTVTVTVITKHVKVGAGVAGVTGGGSAAAGGPVGGAEGDAGFAEGAVDIKGPGTSMSDSILAFLSKGESVINAAATEMFKPVLELMNTNPQALRNALAPKLAVGALSGGGGGGVSENMNVGDIHISINGIDSKDVVNINWRKAVRDQIAPELKRLKGRRAII
jgi:hypothetical protein